MAGFIYRHHSGRFTDAPLLLQILVGVLAARKLRTVLRENVRNLRLAWNDMEYTEEQYAWAFARWSAEEKASQAELAAIVAQIEGAAKSKGRANSSSASESHARRRSKSPMSKGRKAK